MASASPKQKPGFTEEQAKVLLGKRILIGITHCNHTGVSVSQEQLYGTIERANPQEGLVIKINDTGALRTVPLDVSTLRMARPGQYRLHGSDKIIEDPNYTMMVKLYSAD